ncbi:hypothetical protein LY90DRAFT_506357 [Neocallimastix californiae]|uniref:Uncharacterized protein n=1 Tax=Neocallimastix californiae TaxID=1754190 RepID=A0A1Y2DFQ8_9FUNG|nr:hypothetical protein LY90DRAFT_506357 [Neocallimastix californiae]|eukprot:ORY57956.1 hypothetical protein LY90DRAFT_506357 [Neocallimastix californiae]
MIEYVTKQTNKLPESEWRIYANFDWQKELENQKKENKLNNKFDTRETYYYKNVINKKEEKEENGKQPENDNLPTNPVNNENVVNEPILIESDNYNEENEKENEDIPRASCSLLGRQNKRTNPFAIDD